jgi:hypothetical protein
LGRPFESLGFYTHVGYALVTLGGGSTAEDLVRALTGVEDDAGGAGSDDSRAIEAQATLHMVDLELGWDIALDEHWTLRAALGWSYTFNSKTTLRADKSGLGPARQRGLQTLERAGEFYLDDIFQSYVHPPSLVFGVGYVF